MAHENNVTDFFIDWFNKVGKLREGPHKQPDKVPKIFKKNLSKLINHAMKKRGK